MGLLEPVGPPQRTDLGELPDDVLLGLAATGDLFEDRALLLGRVGSQHPKGIDPVEKKVVDAVLAALVGRYLARCVPRSGSGIAHRPQGSACTAGVIS